MRLLQFLTAALLPFNALAAKKSSKGDRFADNFAKAQSSGSLKLDDSSYSKLTAAPRDYAVAVVLTALEPRFGCALCREFQPEWELLAKSWAKGDKAGESRLLFGHMDFMDGKATFQSVRKSHDIERSSDANESPAGPANCSCPSSVPSNLRTKRKSRRTAYATRLYNWVC